MKNLTPIESSKWNPWALHQDIKEIKEKFEKDNEKEYKPAIVCICGSGKFKGSYTGANEILTAFGIIVLTVGIFNGDSAVCEKSNTQINKEKLDKLHFAKIRLADALVVICPGGYIGESTRKEIDYAKSLGKGIHYMKDSLDYYRGATTPY